MVEESNWLALWRAGAFVALVATAAGAVDGERLCGVPGQVQDAPDADRGSVLGGWFLVVGRLVRGAGFGGVGEAGCWKLQKGLTHPGGCLTN